MKIRILLLLLGMLYYHLSFGQGTASNVISQLNQYSKDSLITNAPQALKYAQSALQSAKHHRIIDGQIDAHINLGNYYQLVGPYDKSIIHFEQALKLAETGKDSAKINDIWFEIAESYHVSNNMSRAIQVFAQVFEYNLKDTTNLENRAIILKQLAGHLYQMKDYASSLQYFMLVLEMQKQLDDEEQLGVAYNNVGCTYRNLADLERGTDYLKKGEAIAQKHKYPRLLAIIYLSQGELLSDFGEYEKAEEKFLQSMYMARDKYKGVYCRSVLEYARLKLRQGKYKQAEQEALKGLQVAHELVSLLNTKQAYELLIRIYEMKQQPQDALNAYKKFHTLRDSIQNSRNHDLIKNLKFRYETEARIKENQLLKNQQNENLKLINETKTRNTVLIIVMFLVFILLILLYLSNASARQKNENLKKQTQDIQEAYTNIELLSEIGQTVMAELSVEKIADKLYQRVNMLMDASIFGVALYRPDENTLYFEGVKERGETLPPFSQDLNEQHQHFAVWSFRHNKEVFINDLTTDYAKYEVNVISVTTEQIPMESLIVTEDTPLSLIYLPLMNQDKPIGVITVQSFERNAYSEYDLNVLKNLANYVSTALINATAYDKITNQKDEINAQKTQLQWQKSVSDTQNKTLGLQKAQLDERNVELQAQQQELQKTLNNLQNAQSQLVQSEKLSSLGQLTAGIAHEINNSINFVYAGTDILKEHLAELMEVVEQYDIVTPENYSEKLQQINLLKQDLLFDETKKEIFGLVDDISYGAERTTEIVRGLRTFSRLDEKELKRTDLHQNIDATLIILRNQYKNNIELIKNYAPDFPLIECYPGKVNQVFMNIINNAIQAVQGKGQIEIATRLVHDTYLISDDVDKTPLSNPFAEISIRDTGSGMSDETIAHIFEPFFTTKAIGKGTGLGLHISMEIIQKHKGKIVVDSQINEGTTFRICLPLHQLPSKKSEKAHQNTMQ